MESWTTFEFVLVIKAPTLSSTKHEIANQASIDSNFDLEG